MKRVGIIDYRMGNLTSVFNAFRAVGADVEIVDHPARLESFTHIVLPGVGAFGEGMARLRTEGWVNVMERLVRREGRPFLGICLGMQLLASHGTEHGDFEGLGWVPGDVVRLPDHGESLRIPHIGWNDAVPVRHDACYREGFAEAGVFYFVHSFHLVPKDPMVVDGWCEYGTKFAASLSFGNLWAVQYHPEKSQKAGLQVLRNFLTV